MNRPNVLVGLVKVSCPGDWADEDVEDHLDLVEEAFDKAVEDFRSAVRKIHHELTVERTS